ncbi:hypothetical protein Osc7112_6055 [Oscillatoria nigro-viridis PCC 7112]|uniref:Uncharacterized protein n=1 Tax=Phormidium nigroviride PCC 7112 TaxID=179408 RepID=K9VRX9_9CYAN|nr:hypothetical protein Osc7112_6055 [Oscillatoria nigro-viridis PCC 7112]
MPYSLCPIPTEAERPRVPHLSEKGYMLFLPNFHSRLKTTSAMSQGINSLAACRNRQLTNLRKKPKPLP